MHEELVKRKIRTKSKVREIVTYVSDDCDLRKEHEEVLAFIRENTYNSLFAKAYVPGRGIFVNAKAHMYNDVFLKMDIQDFFHSINHEKLALQLFREIKHAKITQPDMDLCKDIVQTCSCGCLGLPLGLVTSPDLANLYLKKFDSLLYGKLKTYPVENIIYTRYADDMVISFKYIEDYEHFLNQMKADVIDYLAEFDLCINTEKTEIVDLTKVNHVRITGLSVTKSENNYRRISVGKKLKNELFWKAINIYDMPAEERDKYDVEWLKGMMSHVLSVEKEGISFSYSRRMRQLVYDRGYKNLPHLISNL